MSNASSDASAGLASAAGLATADAVPTRGRDIRRLAEGEPHVARRHAGVERLAGGAPSDAREHEVGDRIAVLEGLAVVPDSLPDELVAEFDADMMVR